jgi:preprotein translocase subunit SecA
LRGRSGRQGDPGSTRFYLSLQDDLMRIFASDRVAGLMKKLGMQQGEAIEHPWVTRAIENAQRKVEGHNFDIRKQLLEYDDVANEQRKVIYTQRNEIMQAEEVSLAIQSMREDVVAILFAENVPAGSMAEQWNVSGLEESVEEIFGLKLAISKWLVDDDGLHEETLHARIIDEIVKVYDEKERLIGSPELRRFEKYALLQVLDNHWKEHLAAMDYLRQSIHLRGYAQKNPKQEYKRESFEMFSEMLVKIKQEVVSLLSRVQLRTQEELDALERERQKVPAEVHYQHDDINAMHGDEQTTPEDDTQQQPFVRTDIKPGRNDPCYCGSGKKYKQCHGKLS